MFEKLNTWRIRTYLKKQGINNIDECKKEEDFLEQTREYYKNMEYENTDNKKTKLKDKLILLDNEKNKINKLTYLSEFGLVITITLALFSNTFGIIGKVGDITGSLKTERTAVNLQIEKYEDNIMEGQNNLGIYNDKAQYNDQIIKINADRKQKLIDNFKTDAEDAKKDIEKYSEITTIIFSLFIFLVSFLSLELLIIKSIDSLNSVNRGIAINIHKSVIEEHLKEIEKNEKVHKDEAIKKLDEIERTVEGTQREVETLIRVLSCNKR